MQQQLKEFLHLKELSNQALKGILPMLSDSNIDIKERWEVYKQIEESLPTYSDVANPVDDTIPAKLYRGNERHITVFYSELAESLDFEEHEDFFESVLSSGHCGFVYDW